MTDNFDDGGIATGLSPIDAVSYEVQIEGGPGLAWRVRRFHLVEAISEPYRMTLELISEEEEGMDQADALLGANLTLEYGRNGLFRTVCGLIENVTAIGLIANRLELRVHVAPALQSMALRNDTRFFQDYTVPEILDQVLGPALDEYGRTLEIGGLGEHYVRRDYCVQFKETDLDFCHRLMEEEGISYYFRVEADNRVETMVLLDRPNKDFPQVESIAEESIPIIVDRYETAETDSVQYLEWLQRLRTTQVSTRRFNWKRPDLPEWSRGSADARGRSRETYDPDAQRRSVDDFDDTGYLGPQPSDDERARTERRHDALRADGKRGQGRSNVIGFRAGGWFDLDELPDAGLPPMRMLLVRVEHVGECSEQELGAAAGDSRYSNTFESMPASIPFRPAPRTPQPRIYGAQTAIVTGPPGEEIHTDEHGRIKVIFHWDRRSPRDSRSSCWVRVAQAWAGNGWGTFFLPRIGMEVVVQFLDGNPDRPLVSGCVYNGNNRPPYALPDEKTISTIKSKSSMGGEGFNEIRFEDRKGAEQIYVHAEKDCHQRVENDRLREVQSNETIRIEGNRRVSILGQPTSEVEYELRGQEVFIDGHHQMTTTQTIKKLAEHEIQLVVSKDAPTSATIRPKSIVLETAGGLRISMNDEDNSIRLSTGKGATLIMQGKYIKLN